jgi:hypothetical protein
MLGSAAPNECPPPVISESNSIRVIESFVEPSDSWLDFISSTSEPDLRLTWTSLDLCQSTLEADALHLLLLLFVFNQRFFFTFVVQPSLPESPSIAPDGITAQLRIAREHNP